MCLCFTKWWNQEQRRRLLQEMCANDSVVFPGKNRSFDDIPNKELDHLIVDDRHGIIYCYVPKVRKCLRFTALLTLNLVYLGCLSGRIWTCEWLS